MRFRSIKHNAWTHIRDYKNEEIARFADTEKGDKAYWIFVESCARLGHAVFNENRGTHDAGTELDNDA